MTLPLSSYAPTAEGEGRLLLLLHSFSLNGGTVQGRTKLAKLRSGSAHVALSICLLLLRPSRRGMTFLLARS